MVAALAGSCPDRGPTGPVGDLGITGRGSEGRPESSVLCSAQYRLRSTALASSRSGVRIDPAHHPSRPYVNVPIRFSYRLASGVRMRDPESPNRPATAEGARRLALALVAAIALSASSPPAFGQNADRQVQFDILLLQWEFQLDLVEDEVSKEQANESLLEIFRPQLAGIQRTARSIRDRNAASAAETGKLLATLGPPPPGRRPRGGRTDPRTTGRPRSRATRL